MSKNILITGASSGIGAACARASIDEGYKVALAARSIKKLEKLVNEFGEDRAIAIECDVTDPKSQENMFKIATDRFKTLDVVFANAGLGATANGTEHGHIDNFRECCLVNNFGVTVTCKFAIPHLRKTKGNLILIGSQAGHLALAGSVYSATKWFIRGYAKNLANELTPQGIRVTSIDPGMVDTPFFDDPKPDALKTEDIGKAFLYAMQQPPRGRIAEIEIYPTVGGH